MQSYSMSGSSESLSYDGLKLEEEFSYFYEHTCKIIEHDRGPISILEFVFTQKQERRISKPFDKSLIVKLLGRMIGLKAFGK